MIVAHTLAAEERKGIEMLKENLKAELEKLDQLQKQYQSVIATCREHIKADRVDLFQEDEEACKKAEEAWNTQFKKVYADALPGVEAETTNTAAQINRAQISEELEKVVKIQDGPEIAAEESKEEASAPDQGKEWWKERTIEGKFVVTVFKNNVERRNFIADAYMLSGGITEREIIEVRVRQQGKGYFKKYSKILGDEIIITNAETYNEVFRMELDEYTPQIINIEYTGENIGYVRFRDGSVIGCKKESIETYETKINSECKAMQRHEKSMDEFSVYMRYKLRALYALEYITQYDYVVLTEAMKHAVNINQDYVMPFWEEIMLEETDSINLDLKSKENVIADIFAKCHYMDKMKYYIIADAVSVNTESNNAQIYRKYTARWRLKNDIQIIREMGHKVEVKEQLRNGNYQVERIIIDGIPLYEKSEGK